VKYTGNYNTRCPLCKKQIVGGHPVVIRLNGEVKRGKRVCSDCFKPWTDEYSKLQTERSIMEFESSLETQLNNTEFGCPPDHEIKGFWFCQFENGPMGIILNYSVQD
jgi:hypothetical protein